MNTTELRFFDTMFLFDALTFGNDNQHKSAEMIQFCHDMGPCNGAPCLIAITGD